MRLVEQGVIAMKTDDIRGGISEKGRNTHITNDSEWNTMQTVIIERSQENIRQFKS